MEPPAQDEHRFTCPVCNGEGGRSVTVGSSFGDASNWQVYDEWQTCETCTGSKAVTEAVLQQLMVPSRQVMLDQAIRQRTLNIASARSMMNGFIGAAVFCSFVAIAFYWIIQPTEWRWLMGVPAVISGICLLAAMAAFNVFKSAKLLDADVECDRELTNRVQQFENWKTGHRVP